jgi:hypothetical protein
LNDTARLAWARENQASGKTVDPRDTPVDYIETWKDAFYGSDHNVPLVKELDQQMIDYAASKTPANKPFDWHLAFGQNGEKGLISQQFTQIDCGPNAFSTIARSRGLNMTPQQALPFAQQHGYHNGNEFTGPENYARMLRSELGLDAKTGRLDQAGWSAIDKELAEGRPVTLSSPGHYWVVTGKNDQGQYYAGATNTFLKYRQGQNWVDKGAFSFGGPADTYITAKGDVDPNARAIKEMHLQPPAMTMQSTRENLTQRVPVPRTTNTLTAPAAPAAQAGYGRNGGGTYAAPASDMNQTIRGTRMQMMSQSGPYDPDIPGNQGSRNPVPDVALDRAVAEPPPRPPDIAWWDDADPSAGLMAGEGRGKDVGAHVWQAAYENGDHDARFATLVGGLVNGEGGFSGKTDNVGAVGIFQFDPRYNEGKEFASWLKLHNIQDDPNHAARNVDLAMGYYAPYLKDAYDRAVARGVTDENELITAMVKEPSRRGYGHNSGASGANLQNYIQGLQEYKRGQFRLLAPARW